MLKGIAEAHTLKLVEVNEIEVLEKTVRDVTWHTMRVTMLSEAVKAQVDDKIVGLQANWKDPSQLVLKYARQRKELSVAMVKGMTEKLRQAWVPDRQHFVVEEEDEEITEPIVPEFIVKASLPASALSSSDLRCQKSTLTTLTQGVVKAPERVLSVARPFFSTWNGQDGRGHGVFICFHDMMSIALSWMKGTSFLESPDFFT